MVREQTKWVCVNNNGAYMKLVEEYPATWSEWTDVLLEATLFETARGRSHDHRWSMWTGRNTQMRPVLERIETTRIIL